MPAIPKGLIGVTDIFAQVREGDILLHHPYESFDPVIQFLQQAAEDEKVLAIKATLYRTSGKNSPIVRALLTAAENEKQVAVIIELKARFDEENNIEWARRLERAGAHVVYGFANQKVHAKTLLVVREDDDGLRRYMHFGTGNYNEKTARLYTDLSLFTCRSELGTDDAQLFNALTGFSKVTDYEELWVAPVTFHRELIARIDRETEHARAGRPAGIRGKINAITEGDVVRALYRASQAGVPIDLLVRGMCVLRPGVAGVSENIRVRSIVGRFLEHSRIFVFENGGDRETYIASADWMGRNLIGASNSPSPCSIRSSPRRSARTFSACCWPTTSRAASCATTERTGVSHRVPARCRSTRSASFLLKRKVSDNLPLVRHHRLHREALPALEQGHPDQSGLGAHARQRHRIGQRLDVGDVDHEPDRLIGLSAPVEVLALAIELGEIRIGGLHHLADADCGRLGDARVVEEPEIVRRASPSCCCALESCARRSRASFGLCGAARTNRRSARS